MKISGLGCRAIILNSEELKGTKSTRFLQKVLSGNIIEKQVDLGPLNSKENHINFEGFHFYRIL